MSQSERKLIPRPFNVSESSLDMDASPLQPEIKQSSSSTKPLISLTFSQFLRLDTNKLNIQLLTNEDELSEFKNCIIGIEISNIPCFQVTRTFYEITAFYKTVEQSLENFNLIQLRAKFPSVSWPSKLLGIDSLEGYDIWKDMINQIFKELQIIATTNDEHRKLALCLIYVFLIDKEAIEKLRNLITLGNIQGPRPNRSWSEDDINVNVDSMAQLLQGIVNEFENKIIQLESDGINLALGRSKELLRDTEPLDLDTENRLGGEQIEEHKNMAPPGSIDNMRNGLSRGDYQPVESRDRIPFQYSEESLGSKDGSATAEPTTPYFTTPTKQKNETLASHLHSQSQETMNRSRKDSESDAEISSNKTEKQKTGSKLKELWNKTFSKTAHSPPKSNSSVSNTATFKSPPNISINPIPTTQNAAYSEVSDSSFFKDFNEDTPINRSENDISVDRDSGEYDNRMAEPKRSKVDVSSRSNSTRDINKLIKKEIPNFSGNIYMKLSLDHTWKKYFARIKNAYLLLYHTSGDTSPKHIVPCFRCTVVYAENEKHDYIKLFHNNDSEKMKLLIDPTKKNQDESVDPFKNLRMWFVQLRIATQKIDDLNLTFHNYYPIGKSQFVVAEASNLRGLTHNSLCLIRISHTPYVLQTSEVPFSESMKWKQTFFIKLNQISPLCDSFLPIKMELVGVHYEGWLKKETRREEVICTGEILVSDILSIRSNGIFNVNINFQYVEAKKKQLLKALSTNEADLGQPLVRVRIRHLSNIKSLFAPAYGEYVEGIAMDPETYVKQHFKLSVRRTKRIIRYIRLFFADVQTIFNYKYPFFSYCCLFLFSSIIVTLPIQDLIPNTILLILSICVLKHPNIENRLKPIVVDFFFKDEYLNSFYRKPCIMTTEDMDTRKDLNTEKWKYKIVDEDNLVTQILLIKRVLTGITITVTKIAGFCEKLKNLMLWKEPIRTYLFVGIGLVFYCILAILPFRWTLLFIVWMKFVQGVGYYEKLMRRNREAATMTINFIIRRYFNTYYQQICKNPKKNWPIPLNFNNFQKKMAEQLKFRLGVLLPENGLCIYKSPEELTAALSSCQKYLTFKTDPTEKAGLGLVRWKYPKFTSKNLISFIMNVPSDYYRVVHPRVINPDGNPDQDFEDFN